jgi:hypothetical protein
MIAAVNSAKMRHPNLDVGHPLSIHAPIEGADRVESRFRFGILDAYDESRQDSSPLFEPCRTNLALALSDGKLPQLR